MHFVVSGDPDPSGPAPITTGYLTGFCRKCPKLAITSLAAKKVSGIPDKCERLPFACLAKNSVAPKIKISAPSGGDMIAGR